MRNGELKIKLCRFGDVLDVRDTPPNTINGSQKMLHLKDGRAHPFNVIFCVAHKGANIVVMYIDFICKMGV